MRRKNLTKFDKREIIKFFSLYKQKGVTLKDIGTKFNTDPTNIGKIFRRKLEDKYRKISKIKSYEHSLKDESKEVILFNRYKKGEKIEDLAKEIEIKTQSLRDRFYKKFNREYMKIRIERNGKKVSFSKIRLSFKKYKENKVSLAELAKEIEIAESSLTARFKNHFKKEYRKVAKSRKDERKVTKEEYIRAFKEYESTPISLTRVANSLGIKIGSLRPRFIKLFEERYKKVAKEKISRDFFMNRGRIAERLALEYLRIIGLNAQDTGKNHPLKIRLKDPILYLEKIL